MKKPLLTFVTNAAQSEAVFGGAELFRQEHGHLLDLRLFCVHDIGEEAISSSTVS